MSDKPADKGADEAAKADTKSKPAKTPPAAMAVPPATEKPAKKGGFPWVFILIPVAIVAALVLAFALPPTHAMLLKSPLGPIVARLGGPAAKTAGVGGKAGAPATSPSPDAKSLADAVEADKKAAAQKDAQITQLQAQVTQLQTPPSPTPAAKPTPAVVTDDMKRAATYWAAMDADKAADIIKVLPEAYVKSVFSQMPADAVSDIMSELPPKTAARLTVSGAGP
jgi:flagellar motility protein MotE (MotC chaperone)